MATVENLKLNVTSWYINSHLKNKTVLHTKIFEFYNRMKTLRIESSPRTPLPGE